MNDSFTLLCASNVVEAQRVKALLEEHNIFAIIKDESESARLAGFGSRRGFRMGFGFVPLLTVFAAAS